MGDSIGKWAAGPSYGPVLSQTDLYLLQTELQLHPILTNSSPSFNLHFNISTGQTGGLNPEASDRDLPFAAQHEPATLPRVGELMIITPHSPWCTVIRNERGVTLGDVCTAIWKDYTENYVTDAEFLTLNARQQDLIKRCAASGAAGNQWGQGYYGTPAANPTRYKRSDWLTYNQLFESLSKNDAYTVNRLGFKAPNIFVMTLTRF